MPNLKFIERARSEWVRSLGMDQAALRADNGMVFAVRRVVADYLRPAQYDDILQVRTNLESLSGARIILAQTVLRDEELLFQAEVTLVCLTATGRPARLPDALRRQIAAA